MVYKKIEYREFNSLEEIVRWEELNLDKKYKAIRGDLIYSHDPTAQAILQYSGFLYRPLNYYGRISSNAIIRCGNKKYIKYTRKYCDLSFYSSEGLFSASNRCTARVRFS